MNYKLVPEHCAMPDLYKRFAPQFQTLTYLLMTVSGTNADSLSENALKLRQTIIRLVDKANREYMTARNHLIEQILESNRPYEELVQGRIIHMFGFFDEIENCVISCRRLLDLLEKVVDDTSIPDATKIQAALDPGRKKNLTDFRNTIEHMAERITSEQISDSKPIVISLSEDSESIVIGNNTMPLRLLADILTSIHSAGFSLLPKLKSKEEQGIFD